MLPPWSASSWGWAPTASLPTPQCSFPHQTPAASMLCGGMAIAARAPRAAICRAPTNRWAGMLTYTVAGATHTTRAQIPCTKLFATTQLQVTLITTLSMPACLPLHHACGQRKNSCPVPVVGRCVAAVPALLMATWCTPRFAAASPLSLSASQLLGAEPNPVSGLMRLFNGTSPSNGRLQVLWNGNWQQVTSSYFDSVSKYSALLVLLLCVYSLRCRTSELRPGWARWLTAGRGAPG